MMTAARQEEGTRRLSQNLRQRLGPAGDRETSPAGSGSGGSPRRGGRDDEDDHGDRGGRDYRGRRELGSGGRDDREDGRDRGRDRDDRDRGDDHNDRRDHGDAERPRFVPRAKWGDDNHFILRRFNEQADEWEESDPVDWETLVGTINTDEREKDKSLEVKQLERTDFVKLADAQQQLLIRAHLRTRPNYMETRAPLRGLLVGLLASRGWDPRDMSDRLLRLMSRMDERYVRAVLTHHLQRLNLPGPTNWPAVLQQDLEICDDNPDAFRHTMPPPFHPGGRGGHFGGRGGGRYPPPHHFRR